MKKHLLPLFLAFIAISATAQISIPNGNFETWISGTANYPQYYPYNPNNQNFFTYRIPFNLEKSTEAFHGTYAVRLFTNASSVDTSGGYFANSPTSDASNWHGGVPYTLIPIGVRGYYKCNIVTGDSGLVLAAFSKAGNNIGTYFFKLGGVKSSYTLFNFTFNPALSQAPDSVIFGATSSNLLVNKSMPGSNLFIDSVSFTGVASQPALLNGDFESWQSEILYRPFSWYGQENGTKRTSESFAGAYAAELTTFLGSNNGVPDARGGQISTGYYVNSCNCTKGGYPFSNNIDTLVFHYKYAPSIVTDSASFMATFKKNGSQIFRLNKNLEASASYKYVEIPFNMVSAPDSVILDIISSLWTNKSVSYVGAVLKIDEIYFKSQMLPTSIKSNSGNKSIIIYPNPSGGKFTIQIYNGSLIQVTGKVIIYNEMGVEVLKSAINNQKSDIDISGMPNGIYYVKIFDGVVTHTAKIVKR